MSRRIVGVCLALVLLVNVCTAGVVAQDRTAAPTNGTEVQCTTETANLESDTANAPVHSLFYTHDVPRITVYGELEWVRPKYSVSRSSDDTITVEATLDFAGTIDSHDGPIIVNNRFVERSPNVSLQRTEGFHRDDTGRFVWDNETNPATIEYDLSVGDGVRVGDGLLVRNVGIPSISIFSDNDYTSVSVLDPEYSVENGYRTVSGTLYLGEYAEYERQNGDETFRIIVPESIGVGDREANVVLDRLSNVSSRFHVGVRHSAVEFVVVPNDRITRTDRDLAGRAYGTNPSVGRWSNRSSAVIGSSVNPSNHVWIHEYVHTRQEFIIPSSRESEFVWFSEGSAEYYESLLAYEAGKITYQRFHREVTTTQGTSDDVLGDPDSWTDRSTEYEKGALVLAALDAEIRGATNGTKSLQSVFWRMNANVNPRYSAEGAANSEYSHHEDGLIWINYDRFKEIVAVVAGESFDEWLDEYVTTDATPTVPEDRSLYESPQYTDSDRDGIPDRIETDVGTDPTDSHTDADTIEDGTEMFYCLTDPRTEDTDGDGLADDTELLNKTIPSQRDTDGDSFDDYEEIQSGTDPRDRGDHPETTPTRDSSEGVGLAILLIVTLVMSLVVGWLRRLN